MFRSLALFGLLTTIASAGPVSGIASFSSNLVFPSTNPGSLQSGKLESNTTVYGFVEAVGTTLSDAIVVDSLTNGAKLYDRLLDLTPGSIAAGTQLNSYFLHFDPAGAFGGSKNPGLVEIEFDPFIRIIGFQMSVLTLNSAATDQVKMPGVTYESRPVLTSYGLEFLLGDTIELTNHHTIQINMNSSLFLIDNLRIFVATPEPSYALLIASAIGLLLWSRRRAYQGAR